MDRIISEQKVLKTIDNLKANFTCYDSVTLDEVASRVKAIPSEESCNDAISRQAVIEKQYRIDDSATLSTRDVVNVDDIEDLPSIKPQEPKWIPVSERLPKPNEYVGNVCRYYLIQNKYGDMMVARWDGQGWEQMYQYGEYIEDEVIAWMPLPAPYEPQESEVKE